MSFTATAFYKDIRDYVGTSLKPILWNNNPPSVTGTSNMSTSTMPMCVGLPSNLIRPLVMAICLYHGLYLLMISEGSASNPGENFSGTLSTEEVNRFIFAARLGSAPYL
jgi:hypothetical protein